MALHNLEDHQKLNGWQLVLNYMQTPPPHHSLESNWQVAYMKTQSNQLKFMKQPKPQHRANPPPPRHPCTTSCSLSPQETHVMRFGKVKTDKYNELYYNQQKYYSILTNLWGRTNHYSGKSYQCGLKISMEIINVATLIFQSWWS